MTTPQAASTIAALRQALTEGSLHPGDVAREVLAAIAAHDDPAVWIGAIDGAAVERAAGLLDSRGLEIDRLPLYGIPFAVKDNIDIAGQVTTAGCPAFASVAAASAQVVERLLEAGAVVVGKTNLDQFATGLVGTRTPYGVPRNPFDPSLVPGGSSSGSAVAVAAGLVPFALGTDTAGSGRIPAAIMNVVGFKPTPGLVSTRGVVPACRSLDCISVFALTADDAVAVFEAIAGLDLSDPYARPQGARHLIEPREPTDLVLGVPDAATLAAHVDAAYREAFARQVDELRELGARVNVVDMAPFLAVGDLMYDGPWVAERLAAVGDFIEGHPDDVLAVTRAIILGARRFSADDAFRAEYHRRELAIATAGVWDEVDVLCVPSVPGVPSLDDVVADPVGVNARLGRFSTFVNLLDLCAVATPGGFTSHGGAGRLPAGFTLIGPACTDRLLLALAGQYQETHGSDRALGALQRGRPRDRPRRSSTVEHRSDATTIPLVVVGAHLTGQPLNHQLTGIGASLAATTTTAPVYRLYAIAETTPPKPGLVRVGDGDGGASIEVEVWDVPAARLGSFVAAVAPPLAIGAVCLSDGRWVSGFVCEPTALDGATDITTFGGWRAWIASR